MGWKLDPWDQTRLRDRDCDPFYNVESAELQDSHPDYTFQSESYGSYATLLSDYE